MLLKGVRKLWDLYLNKSDYLCKVEEVSESLNRIVISCREGRAALTLTIQDVVGDEYIINSLPPHQACWLGYYFGKKWTNKLCNRNFQNEVIHSSQQYSSEYTLIGQNRSGDVIYQSDAGNVYQIHPLDLAKSEAITRFNSSQAFYIGFLAAIKKLKQENKQIFLKPEIKRSHIRLIK